ncbi:MAG: PAS domain-containing protein [Methylococcaceae bacterium]|nr:PAS domain-containing protein [Methylococcaceae bacterium]
MSPPATNPQSLQDAFERFNALSETLSRSYGELESQVVRLSEELAAARDERLKTLVEKERLANRLQHLLEALPGGVLVVDGSGRIVDHNPAAARMLGGDLKGRPWRAVLQAACRDGDSPHPLQLADGSAVSVSFNSLGDEPGQIVLLTDVSEMRALQELVSQQKRLSALGEMVASLAHQIRTPLAAALLYTSHLGNGELTAAHRQKFAAKVSERLLHMERQVNDMLAFARMGQLAVGRVSLLRLLAKAADGLGPALADGRIRLMVENRSAAAELIANEDALLGILLNLLNNACEAMGQTGGTVRLEVLDAPPGRICIAVADTGPGIPEDALGRIFEPFFTTRPNGTGLGLAIVECVVRAHGGAVRCESAPGQGARFFLELPVAPPAALPSGAGDRADKSTVNLQCGA